jgi:hypothetical protein
LQVATSQGASSATLQVASTFAENIWRRKTKQTMFRLPAVAQIVKCLCVRLIEAMTNDCYLVILSISAAKIERLVVQI